MVAGSAAGATAARQMVPNTNNTGQLNICIALISQQIATARKMATSVGRPSLHNLDIPNFYAAQIDCIKLIRAMRYIGLVQKYRWLGMVRPCQDHTNSQCFSDIVNISFACNLPGQRCKLRSCCGAG